MSKKKSPLRLIQTAIDIQEQCVPARGPARDYMIGMLNGLLYSKYAVSGGSIEFHHTSVIKKIRHKSIKKLR